MTSNQSKMAIQGDASIWLCRKRSTLPGRSAAAGTVAPLPERSHHVGDNI